MEKFLEKLNSAGKMVKLEAGRKDAIKARLFQLIEAEGDMGVREAELARHNIQQRSLWTKILKPMPIIATLAIMALLGGGTSFAAESALPGDTLYPVKVDFNEKVMAATHLSAQSKASLEADLAERRLQEAEQLATEAKLSDEAKAELESRFQAHADAVSARVAKLQDEGEVDAAAEVSSDFEGSLQAHEEVLKTLASEDNELSLKINPLLLSVRGNLTGTSKTRTNLENKISADTGAQTKTAAQGKLNAAANVIASTKAYINNKKAKLGTEATAAATAELNAAEDLSAQAKVKLDAGAYGEAFNLANQAIQVAQKAKILVEARTKLNINVGIEGLHLRLGDEEGKADLKSEDEEIEGATSSSSSTSSGNSTSSSSVNSNASVNAHGEINEGASVQGSMNAESETDADEDNAGGNLKEWLKLKFGF